MLKHVLGPIEQAFLHDRAKLHAMAEPRLVVAMYCRAGHRRFVGIGELLCAAFQQETLVEAPPVRHLCEFGWYRKNCQCCAQCRAHCADTQWAHKQATDAARSNHDDQCYSLFCCRILVHTVTRVGYDVICRLTGAFLCGIVFLFLHFVPLMGLVMFMVVVLLLFWDVLCPQWGGPFPKCSPGDEDEDARFPLRGVSTRWHCLSERLR